MEYNYIKSIELRGIHKRYDLDIEFNSSLNILHGQNGTGKSTLIHIIANIVNCDFIRFAFLDFSSIRLEYSSGDYVKITQYDDEENTYINVETKSDINLQFTKRSAFEDVRELEDERFAREFTPELTTQIKDFVKDNKIQKMESYYFPAFRTMLEAWSSRYEPRMGRVRKLPVAKVTHFARELFGQFLPAINYPSPIDIENSLRDEIRDRQIRIARYESSVFSESFVKVFSALLENQTNEYSTENLLNEISNLTQDSGKKSFIDFEENAQTYRRLQQLVSQSSQFGELKSTASGALVVYRDALKERQEFQQKAFREIDTYFNVVNSFLDKKELAYEQSQQRRVPRVGLKFPDGTWSSIRVMSSGERQLLTMLYAVNKMSGNSAVLIDEPELSLHIDWQEELLEKMMEHLGDRQIIVCTHSPSIAAGFDDYMKEVAPIFNENLTSERDFLNDELEEDF